MLSFLQITLKLLPPLSPRWIEEQILSSLPVVPIGRGDSLFVTGDHFFHVAAGHGRECTPWLWGREPRQRQTWGPSTMPAVS